MSDEKDIQKIHGFEIDSHGHEGAMHHLEKHVKEEQLREMVHNAKNSSDHNSHFTARVDGHDVEYKLEHHDGQLKIDRVHHS